MAKRGNKKWDSTDDFMLDRWAKASDFTIAYLQTTKKMRRQLNAVGEALAASVKSQGYEVDWDGEWAEFTAYRPDWCNAKGEPLVELTVGGVYPTGYLSVEVPAAYLLLFLSGFADDETDRHRQFADTLYKELGGRPDEWQDRTDDTEWFAPLWTHIPNTDDSARNVLARDEQQLRRLVLQQFQRFFPMGDAISRAVRQCAST